MVVRLEQRADNSRSTYKIYDLHTIFYSRLSVSKSIFYVSLGNIFTVFVEALVVKAPGQLPSSPPPALVVPPLLSVFACCILLGVRSGRDLV